MRSSIIGAKRRYFDLICRIAETLRIVLGSFSCPSITCISYCDASAKHAHGQFVDTCQDVAAFVRRHAVNAIYITLPMNNAPRMEEMLDQFRDTTASIYFVPDIFAFNLVQARCVEISGIPMLSICDTPFHGMNAVKKRAIDIVLSSLALLLAWPVMLAIAIAMKFASPGPVLFKQRRSRPLSAAHVIG